MALATQCPHCQTTFKVAHDQLKLRTGLVRCGACKQVFNGIEHLVPPDQLTTPVAMAKPANALPLPDHTPSPLTQEQPQQPMPPSEAGNAFGADAPQDAADVLEFALNDDPETQTRILSPAPQDSDDLPAMPGATEEDPLTRMTLVDFTAFDLNLDQDDQPATPAKPVAAPSTEAANPVWPDTQHPFADPSTTIAEMADAAAAAAYRHQPLTGEPEKEKQAAPAPGADFGAMDADEQPATAPRQHAADLEEPGFVTRSRRRQRMSKITRVFMSLASVLLVLGLLGQAAYAFRDQLAAWFPQAKPELAQLCRLLGCQIKLPAQIDMVSIESHELQALANNKNVFALTLLLRNRSAVTQAWPTIELTLNDGNEKPLVRRMLAPGEYLSTTTEAAKGFAAQSEQPVRVLFELPQLTASGYRVYLFYP